MSAGKVRRPHAARLIPAALALAIPIAHAQTLPPPLVSPVLVTAYQYDAEGNPTRHTLAPGVPGFGLATQHSYDALNQLRQITNALSGTTQLNYDGRGHLTQVTDPRSLITQSPHTGLGDRTTLVSPDTGTSSFTYDAAGNLLTALDARGVLATHSYDALNRLTQVTYSQSGEPSRTLTWIYDETGPLFAHGVGRLTTMTHPDGLAQFSYDLDGRVASVAQLIQAAAGANPSPVTRVTEYEYDAAGRRVRLIYPSGRVVHYGYTHGRISSVGLAPDDSSSAQPLLSQILYQPFGAPKSWLWHLNGAATQSHERIYDTAARLVRYRLGDRVRDLSYDAANRIVGYTHRDALTGAAAPGYDQDFEYDGLGRLTAVTLAGGSMWEISYDANGNRTGVMRDGTGSAYTISGTSNRLTAIAATAAKSFSHDAVGNTTAETGTGGYSATYSLENRLATLTAGGTTTTYTYNNLGQRVRKSGGTAASTVLYVYDEAGKLLGEYDSAGVALREYVWLGEEPVAMLMPDSSPANPPTVVYLHTDHLGTPRLAYDRNNQLRWRWEGEPFGANLAEEDPSSLGTIKISLRLPGQVYDPESGLHYNYFRDYDPRIGRYVQSDPIGLAGGINTYAYAENNPLSWVDPAGLATIYSDGSVSVTAYPGPQAGGVEHARQGPGQAYHVHVRDASGRIVRVSTETWRPLTLEDQKVYDKSRSIRNFCDSLTDGEKKFFDRVNRQVFHRGLPTQNQMMRLLGLGRSGVGSNRGTE